MNTHWLFHCCVVIVLFPVMLHVIVIKGMNTPISTHIAHSELIRECTVFDVSFMAVG